MTLHIYHTRSPLVRARTLVTILVLGLSAAASALQGFILAPDSCGESCHTVTHTASCLCFTCPECNSTAQTAERTSQPFLVERADPSRQISAARPADAACLLSIFTQTTLPVIRYHTGPPPGGGIIGVRHAPGMPLYLRI